MRHQWVLYGLATIGGGTMLYALGTVLWPLVVSDRNNDRPRTQVEVGLVEAALHFSGQTRTDTTAQLSFSSPGTVGSVVVREGERVTTGQPLASLESRGLQQELREAQAALTEAIAAQRDLLQGVATEVTDLADTAVLTAETQLVRVTEEQNQAVKNARQTLLSNDLVAFPVDKEERTPAPTITGTYRCDQEGIYQFRIFRSAAESGFSIRVSGLETDTVPVSFTQAVPFGTCGLRARFIESVFYNYTEWTIPIPNQASPTYIQYRNQLQTATLTAQNAIAVATEAVQVAKQQRARDTAPTRSEQINQANARIAQLEARIAGLEIRLAERTLRAPFAGTITAVTIVAGESVSTTPVFTLLGDIDHYEVRVRIPEIDIADLTLQQAARATFDARPREPLTGYVSYISPMPTEIDGVSYFTATITLEEQPDWLRTGLNADIVIVTDTRTSLRLPTGFLTFTEAGATVTTQSANDHTIVPVTVDLVGSNGYTALSGIATSTTVLAP